MGVSENINSLKYQSKILYSNATRQAYREDEARLKAEFKKDLEEQFGTFANDRKDLLFSLAWEYGHSSGFHEVLNFYSDMVELL